MNTAKNNINNTILPKLQTHDTSINSLNSTIQSHTTQIQSIESKNQTQDTKIQSLESKNQSQDTKIQSLESKNQTQDSKIQALENKNQSQDNEISTFKDVLWIDENNNISSVVNTAQISCTIVNGKVHVNGASKFIEAGFVPYLFRRTRKRNPFNDDNRTPAQKDLKYCQKKKGWHLWGSCNSVRINSEVLQFSTNSHEYLHKVASGYTSDTSAIIKIHINKWGYKTIPWGRSTIIVNNLRNTQNPDKMRMIKLPFAVAFGKKILPGQTRVTPALMVSNLAEFSIIYDPSTKKWLFSR